MTTIGQNQAPAFDEITAVLDVSGDLGAAECHGILCALLSCHPGLTAEEWARQVWSGALVGADDQASRGELPVADRAALVALFKYSEQQLADPELGFEPLLPDDGSAMAERVRAIADWCEGYLYGLSLGGIKEFGGFSEPVQEFCRDLIEICRLADDEDEGEDNESALVDVVEYVRMGVLMLRDEMMTLAGAEAGHEKTLH